MENFHIINEIKAIIEKYGSVHCYENIVGSCSKPHYFSFGDKIKLIDGIPYKYKDDDCYIQGFHENHLTMVIYYKNKPVDSLNLKYEKLTNKILIDCLEFLRRN